MDQKQDSPQDDQAKAIRFSENWDTADAVLKDGVEIYGVIKTYQESPDRRDDEHSIIHIEYEFEIDAQQFKKELEFSINVIHIIYGYDGGLYNTPKFKYSLDDFRNSMQAAQKLKIRVLQKPAYWFLVEFNEVMQEVMKHDAVWMQDTLVSPREPTTSRYKFKFGVFRFYGRQSAGNHTPHSPNTVF